MIKRIIFCLLGLISLISIAGATSSLTIGTPTYSSSVLKDDTFTLEVPIEAASVSSQITVTVTLTDNTNGITITSATKTVSYSTNGTQNIQWSLKANNPGIYSNPFTIQATANDGGTASPLTSTTSLTIRDRPVLTVNVSQNATTVAPQGFVQLNYTITNVASIGAASATDLNASLTSIPGGWTVISPANYTISSLSAGNSQTSGYFIVKAPSTTASYILNMSVISAQGDNIIKSWSIVVTEAGEGGAPSISSSAPTSPVTDVPGAVRAFNITVNQTVNVTWKINGTTIQTNSSVSSGTLVNYTNTSAAAGTWNVTASANNANGTASNVWTWVVSAGAGAPTVSSYAPASPVVDVIGATRTFNLTLNQDVNVTWSINGTSVQTNTSVPAGTPVNYSNTSAALGTWNVTAVANNSNGSVSKQWTWIASDAVLTLKTGWNLVSVPFNLTNKKPFAGSTVDKVLYYNASAALPVSDPNIEPLKSYWVNNTGAETTVALFNSTASSGAGGSGAPTRSISLSNGWNMVGPTGMVSMNATVMFGSLGSNLWRVAGYNSTDNAYEIYTNSDSADSKVSDLTTQPKVGYWVFVTRDSMYDGDGSIR